MNDSDLKYLISGKQFQKCNDYSGYQYCPRCRHELEISEIEEKVRPHCKSCGFIYYQNPAPGAGAVIVKDNAILLVKRSINPGLGDWCIPAGFMEWDEHPQQTAIREIKEETGLDISIQSMFDIFMGMDDPRTHAVLIILYYGEVVGGKLTPGDDASEAAYFDFKNTPDNIAFQAHRDALALYRKRHNI
ncbi:MAG: NUDIX hydrolase [candidate division Zixibacteria bacterium]